MDIEFTELVTGYRIRKSTDDFFVDIYLYDSLSSGAGYAVSIANEIGLLLEKTDFLLKDCDCQSACHNCLKHYRNQFAHGMLDRFAALELLNWGIYGRLANEISFKEQVNYIAPLCSILENSGYKSQIGEAGMLVSDHRRRCEIIVYPAMWVEPYCEGKIYISDTCLKYAKPYAIQKIMDSFCQ